MFLLKFHFTQLQAISYLKNRYNNLQRHVLWILFDHVLSVDKSIRSNFRLPNSRCFERCFDSKSDLPAEPPPLQISTSEILLIFGVLRNVELISNTEIEQTTLETHEIGVLFSKSLNETAWTSVVLPRECHERMTRIDRYCVSWRIVTTSDLGGDPCLRSRYSSSSAGRTSICVHFTIKIH